jgi:hypothetical protein
MGCGRGEFSVVGRLAAPIESRDYHEANGQPQQVAMLGVSAGGIGVPGWTERERISAMTHAAFLKVTPHAAEHSATPGSRRKR